MISYIMQDGPIVPTADINGYVPFSDERCAEYIDEGYWQNETFHDVVDRVAAETPEQTAIVGPHREITYEELADKSRRLAAYLVGELGLEPNDRVVFQFPNCSEFLEAFFACSRAGVIPVMLLPRHREAEARHVIELTDARAVFATGDRYDLGFDFVSLYDSLADEYDHFEHTIAVVDEENTLLEDWISFDAARDGDWIDEHGDALEDVTVNPCNPGVMLLSGGTTGMPKGIPRTYNDYVFQWKYMAEVAGVESDWTAFPSVPIGHNASLNCVIGAAIWEGATIAVEPVLKPEALMELIETHEGNYSLPIPTQLIDILNHPDLEEYDLSSLEVIVSGGQKVRPKAVYEFVDRWDVGFCNIFGMAEGPLICTRPEDDVDTQAHTVGRPIAPHADEVRIVNEKRDEEVPQGDAGELAVRGPGYFTGYFRNEKENAENFDEDGWFYTEDVLALNDEGNYEVYGRLKDTIIRGGENIYVPGLEDVLIEHEKIENVAVIGMPDDRLGERPCAYVELANGSDSLTLDELSEYLKEEGIAVFKRPERLEIVEQLPRTEVGKISKKTLRDDIKEKLEAEDAISEAN